MILYNYDADLEVSDTCVRSFLLSWVDRSTVSRRAHDNVKKGKGSPYSITERRVPELIPVLGSQPAGDVSHKPGGRLPLLSSRPAVTPATLKRAATNFDAWRTEARWVWTVCLRQSQLRFEPGPFCAWVQHANHSATGATLHDNDRAINSYIFRWRIFTRRWFTVLLQCIALYARSWTTNFIRH